MYTLYQKLILQELSFHCYCSLCELSQFWYDEKGYLIDQQLEQEVSKRFGFDLGAFTNSPEATYANPDLNRLEPPFRSSDEAIPMLLRKMIEVVRMNHEIKQQTDNPYATENQLYYLVHKVLPVQFDFHYEEHCKQYPLPSVKSYLEEAGMQEFQIKKHLVWVFPHNVLANREGTVSCLFEYQGEAMLYAFGEEFLKERIAFHRLTFFELWKEREDKEKANRLKEKNK